MRHNRPRTQPIIALPRRAPVPLFGDDVDDDDDEATPTTNEDDAGCRRSDVDDPAIDDDSSTSASSSPLSIRFVDRCSAIVVVVNVVRQDLFA